jgi:hypothetical protein
MENNKTVNLIWFGESANLWGKSWIESLLKNTNLVYYYPKKKEEAVLLDNCIVVTNNSESYDYIEALDKANKKYAVILLSDETVSEPMFYLSSPNCVYAARNYFSPRYWNNDKVFTFGLGYRHKFEQYVTPKVLASKRRRVWSFAGSLKADREHAFSCFKDITPYQLNILKFFNDLNGLTTEEYADLLSDTIFCPAPQGGCNLDSFRIYEALEAGSIPVVLKRTQFQNIHPSYWHTIFVGEKEMPFVNALNWEEASQICKKIIKEDRIDEIQQKCMIFWDSWKTKWQSSFTTYTEGLKK